MGAIVTIPLILFFVFAQSKINKEPRITKYRQSPALKGNPKQNGQPLGISSTVKPKVKFKKHEDWIAYIRAERNALNS